MRRGHCGAMIDISIVRVRQHVACTAGSRKRHGRSPGGVTSKVHAVVEAMASPFSRSFTGGAHDNSLCSEFLTGLQTAATIPSGLGRS